MRGPHPFDGAGPKETATTPRLTKIRGSEGSPPNPQKESHEHRPILPEGAGPPTARPSFLSKRLGTME